MTVMEASITFRTEDQERQLRQMAEAITVSGVRLALEKVNPNRDGIQRLLGEGDEIKSAMAEFWLNQLRTRATSNKYASEVVTSAYAYPPEYNGPKPIDEQIRTIAQIFPCLDMARTLDYAARLPELPEGAEGWFAIPSVGALARAHFHEVMDPAEQYCQAILLVLAQIKASRPFYNYRDGQIDTKHLRMHARTAQAMERIIEVQTGDILIVAAQLGLRHRGNSTRRARETFVTNEYGLGSLAVGSIALTHPERYVRWEQLHTDCAGDEFDPKADGVFGCALCLYFRGDGVGFVTDDVDGPTARFGSASGFLSQSEA